MADNDDVVVALVQLEAELEELRPQYLAAPDDPLIAMKWNAKQSEVRAARKYWREIGEYLGTRTMVNVQHNVEGA